MRIAVLILALLGGVAEGFLGFKWLSDAAKNEKMLKQLEELGAAFEKEGIDKNKGVDMIGNLGGQSNFSEKLAEYKKLVKAAYCLAGGAILALLTGILVFARVVPGYVGGILLLLCAIVPAVFEPKTLVFTCFVVLAGLLSFAVRSKKKPVAIVEEPGLA